MPVASVPPGGAPPPSLDDRAFGRLLRAGPVAVVVSRLADGLILDANDAFCRLFGYERADVVGRTSTDLGMWADPADRGRVVAEVLAGRPVRDVAVGVRTRGGAARDVLVSIETVDLDDGPAVVAHLFDVTDRRRAEAARREQERRFRGIFDNTFQFTGLLAPDGTLLEANRTALEFGGLAEADVVGKPFWEARWWTLSAGTQERLRRAIAEAAAGAFVRYEVEVRGAGETTAIIDFSLKPLRGDDGGVALLIPEGRDVTDLRRTERALRESEARFAAYMAHLPGYAWIKDADLTYVYANPRLEETWGAAGGLLGTDGAAVTPPDLLAEVQAMDRAALAGAGAVERVWSVAHPDGETFWQSVKFPFATEDGRCFLGALAFDVTERTRLERELRASEARFRAAFEHAPVGMAVLALDGTWLEVNPALCAITGYTEAELRARTFQSITHPDDLPGDLAQAARLLSGEIDAYQLEKRYLRKDGSVVWVLLAGAVVRDEAGAPTRFLAQVQDISALKRHQIELAEATAAAEAARRAAEAANLAKGRLLSMVGHDVRSPLTAVVGYADLLRQGLLGPVAPEQDEALGTIAAASGRVVALLDDVLDLARIEAGRVELAPERLHVGPLLEGVRREFAPQAAAKGIALAVAAPAGLAVRADPKRLAQVLANLVGNAVKLTDRGSVRVEARLDGGWAEVTVADSGVGIPPDLLPHVFDEFRQAGSRRGGLGLGLAIVRRLVELHGGTVRAESTPGTGSTFTVRLPADRDDGSA